MDDGLRLPSVLRQASIETHAKSNLSSSGFQTLKQNKTKKPSEKGQREISKIEMHFSTILILLMVCCAMAKSYQLGVGRADCTGPPVEIVFVSSILLFFQSQCAIKSTIKKNEILRRARSHTNSYKKQTTNKIEMISENSINK